MKPSLRIALLLALVSGMGSCSKILPATTHPASSPADIKLLTMAPAKYERLGMVSYVVPNTDQWKENADATQAIDALLEKAAAMGANGLLFLDDASASEAMAGVMYKGKYFLVPVRKKPPTVMAQVIFEVKD